MTNYYALRISKRCQTRHDFLEVPLLVIPNLFRDLGVDLIQGRVHDLGRATKDGSYQRPADSGSLKGDPVQEHYGITVGDILDETTWFHGRILSLYVILTCFLSESQWRKNGYRH